MRPNVDALTPAQVPVAATALAFLVGLAVLPFGRETRRTGLSD